MTVFRLCILVVLLAACGHEDNGKPAVEGVPCEVASDCAAAFPELRACEVPVCGEEGVCELGKLPDGTSCRDGSICTEPDYCLQGVCTGVALRCDDSDPCTVDSCDLKQGCVSVPGTGQRCDDGNPCTVVDACNAGVCEGGEKTPGCCLLDGECDDDDPCTDDRCSQNACVNTPNVAACDDGNPCTLEDRCDGAGTCGGDELRCDDGNPCTVDACNPATGLCASNEAEDGTLCEDGNPCTVDDACLAGSCQSGESTCACTNDLDCVELEDGDLCNGTLLCKDFSCQIDPVSVVACNPSGDTACVKSTCEPSSGQCRPLAVLNGSACNDLNPCTSFDGCQDGLCLGAPTDCDDKNPCTFDACSPVTGCTHVANNLACDDGNACTLNDQCAASACQGVAAQCDDGNPCTDDSCDPTSGCKNVPNTASCQDGNACTAGDVCGGGVCTPGENVCACEKDGDCAVKEDGDLCNGTLICVANECVVDPATVVTCNTSGDTLCRKTLCQASTGQCVRTDMEDGTVCTDQDACTSFDACKSGVCVGRATECDDGNVCTFDSCNAATGCVYVPNALPCDDGSACTANDRCLASKCEGAPLDCDDGNVCTDDSCDPASGCVNDPNTDPCEDGEACTITDVCDNGECVPGPSACECESDGDCVQAEDGDLCNGTLICVANECVVDQATVVTCNTSGDTACRKTRCQPLTGTCLRENQPVGTSCSDGDACTTTDGCTSGVCIGLPLDCDDENPCTTDSCHPQTGCTHVANNLSCSDGSACTRNDRCSDTKCVGVVADCDDDNPCTDDSCDPAVGCKNVPNTAACEDGEPCSIADSCENGACVSGPSACECQSDGDCAAAEDGNLCNGSLRCVNNACTVDPATVITCNTSGDTQCKKTHCQPETGLCLREDEPAGTACSDLDKCTFDDVCTSGVCLGEPLDCDDNNPCTADSCNPVTGCVHLANNLVCDDGSACTINDRCTGGRCVGAAADCDDENPCTDDSCDPSTGCKHSSNTDACEDGDACTVGDVCGGGRCKSGASQCECVTDGDCVANEDGNLCNGTLKCVSNSCVVDQATIISCNTSGDSECKKTRCQPATGLCVRRDEVDGTGCDDQDRCTVDDACVSGVCVGSEATCDDGNPCTLDGCSSATGCVYVPSSSGCDDGNRCTVNDVCNAGSCAGVPLICDDGNVCTVDSCDPASGCGIAPAANGLLCNDGNACTSNDRCASGRCTGGAVDCDDDNPCTTDSCDPAVGCVNAAIADNTPCSDNSLCTGGDRCLVGECKGVTVDCDDDNPCTRDGCNPLLGCFTTNEPTGKACSDGDPCTEPDVCEGGTCQSGAFVCGCQSNADCEAEEDGNICNGRLFCDTDGQCKVNPATVIKCADPGNCRVNLCNPATGQCSISAAGDGQSCDDGDECTVNDSCLEGVCGGVAGSCDDDNACTFDACINKRCVHTPAFDGQACEGDGNSCTLDVCQAAVCTHPALANGTACADDGNSCTSNACNNGVCAYTSLADNVACADDGNACTYDVCKTGLCKNLSNDPAPVAANQCFPVAKLTANTGIIRGGWASCGVADQFLYRQVSSVSYYTGAIPSWGCAPANYLYDGDNTGYEYAYEFEAPMTGTCTFIEYNEGNIISGTLFGNIDWFFLDGSKPCTPSACQAIMRDNKTNDPTCGAGMICSYRKFAVTKGQRFYIVADIFDGVGVSGGGHLGFDYNDEWRIEMKCTNTLPQLYAEDFSDGVCNGCQDTVTAGSNCANFDWHAIAGYDPANSAPMPYAYYLGQMVNNSMLGYDCGATTSRLTLPAVALPANATACSVAFDLYMDLDPADANDCVNDLITVKVDPAGTLPPVNAPGATCATNGTTSNPIGYETAPSVRRMSYDLTTYKGQSLQVLLDWSADAAANAGLGAIIDNVEISCTVP